MMLARKMVVPRVSLSFSGVSGCLRALFVALAVCVAAVTASSPAAAKVLQIRDPSHVLSAEDESRLRAAVTPMPFDARLAVTSDYADPQELSRYAHSLVTEPNMVAVAIDPEHRHVQVHFGVDSHVPQSAWQGIERAGNEAFHRAEWEQGTERIFTEASRAVGSAPGETSRLTPYAPAAPAARPSLLGPGLILVLVAGAVLVGLYFARRRAGSGPYDAGPPGSYGPGPYPPYPAGYPPGQYPPQGGMGPVGGGLIGAGLGGLAGYELGKLEGERESRERPSSWDRGGGDADDSRDGGFDAGGGGSSWDGGGNDGGGGGFDGGGGDSGGGGSDF
jgi:hypothetical protein